MKRFRVTRVSKTGVWVIPIQYGAVPPRGMSRKIPFDVFTKDWLRLPQKEVMKKSDYESLERIINCDHRQINHWTKCEKCGKRTDYEVLVVDRWAAWCGCGN